MANDSNALMPLSTRIKDAGIAIRHSRGYIISILQGLEMGWRGWTWCVPSQEIIKMGQFRTKIIKMKVSLKRQKSQNGLANHPSPSFEAAHPFSQAQGPGPGPAPGPGPGPAKKDGKYKRAVEKSPKNVGFRPPGPLL